MNAESQGTNLGAPASIGEKEKMIRLKNPFKRMLDNPVILKELRGRMRGKQAFLLLTLYLGLIASLIGIIYLFIARESYSGGWDPSIRQTVGKVIFAAVVLLELLLVSFIAPGLTAGAITAERERQTFDLLRTTLLSARALVLGKLGSAFTYLFLLILTALPIESLAFLLGGVGVGEMVVSSLMLVVTGIFFCTLGIFFSSYTKRTLTATISSYGAILLSFLLIGVVFMLIIYFDALPYNANPTQEYIASVVIWLLISINPFLAAIGSEAILIDNQSLFITNNTPFGGNGPAYLLSPWIVYVIVHLALTVLLIVLSIRRVKRPDR